MPRAFAFPWCQVQVFEIFVAQWVLAVVFPWLAVSVVQHDGMPQVFGMCFVPFLAECRGVPVKAVLHVPFQGDESLVPAKQAVQQVLVVEQDAFGIFVEVVRTCFGNV